MDAERFKGIVMDSYRILLVSVMIGLSAGYMLDFYSGKIVAIVLAMVPPINGIGGNVGSILGARLSSSLHLGTITPELRDQSVLRVNLAASATVAIIVFAFTGLVYFLASLVTGHVFLRSLKIAGIFFGAGMLLTGIIILTSVMSAFFSYRKGIDPDNVVIPVVTTVVDVAGVVSLLIMVHMVGIS